MGRITIFRGNSKSFHRTSRLFSTAALKSLDSVGLSTENTISKYLIAERADDQTSQFSARQVLNAHYTRVKCEPVPNPYMVAASKSCAVYIGLDPAELSSARFAEAFSGNRLLPGLDSPYCTVYGCHCYGQWFGQLGDGRAMSIGEVLVKGNTENIAAVAGSIMHEREIDLNEERLSYNYSFEITSMNYAHNSLNL